MAIEKSRAIPAPVLSKLRAERLVQSTVRHGSSPTMDVFSRSGAISPVVLTAIFFKACKVFALKNRRCALASKGIAAKHGWASYDAELMPPFPRVRFTRKHQQHAQVMPCQLHFMLAS